MMGEAEMDSTDFGPGDLHDGFPVDDVGDMPDYSGDPGPEDLAPHEPGAEAGYPDLLPAFPGLHSGESWPAGGDDPGGASVAELGHEHGSPDWTDFPSGDPGADAGMPVSGPDPSAVPWAGWPRQGDAGPGDDLALASPTEQPVQDPAVHFGESDVSAGPHTNDVPADPVTPIGPDGNGWDPVAGEYVHNDYPGSDIYTPGKNPA
jgi:hypothetical protein